MLLMGSGNLAIACRSGRVARADGAAQPRLQRRGRRAEQGAVAIQGMLLNMAVAGAMLSYLLQAVSFIIVVIIMAVTGAFAELLAPYSQAHGDGLRRIAANMAKLSKRYPVSYTDELAIARLDKQ